MPPVTGCPRVEPLGTAQLAVLDGARQPRPDWVPGALCLGEPGKEPRSTGEQARRLPDGRFEILGDQEEAPLAKLGYGADPRRIEAALQQSPAVRHAVVAWRGAGEQGRLVAWVVPAPGRRVQERELRRHLLSRLPEHRLPAVFVFLDSLPLRPDGCVDRSALVLPADAPQPSAAAPASWSPLETELAGFWEEILGRRPESRSDDFFALGGDSLKVTRLMARVTERFGLSQPLPAFFARPTIEGLAELVAQARTAERRRVSPVRRLLSRLPGRGAGAPEQAAAFQANTGMRAFWIMWIGQIVSNIGTGLGSFSLGLWIFRLQSSATQFAMVGVVAMVTGLLLGPVSGAFADRFDRKRLILVSDAGSACMTMLMSLAFLTGQIRPWHVYIIASVMTGLNVLQRPAYMASIPLMVPRRQLIRVGALGQITGSISGIITPPLAGALLGFISYQGVIFIDCLTFVLGFVTVAVVRIPQPAVRAVSRGSIVRDLVDAAFYLKARTGLMVFLLLNLCNNFSMGIVQALLTPMVLSFASALELGSLNAAASIGAGLGALVLGAWGGPRRFRRMRGIRMVLIFQGLLIMMAGLQPSLSFIVTAMFLFYLTVPVIGAFGGSIWQTKVAPELQGRVFALIGMAGTAAAPIAFALAGPLADRVFTPLLMPNGPLADSAIGRLVGVGPGRGIGLLFLCAGFLVIVVSCLFFLNRRLRNVETELPDVVRPQPATEGETQPARAA